MDSLKNAPHGDLLRVLAYVKQVVDNDMYAAAERIEALQVVLWEPKDGSNDAVDKDDA